MFDITASIVLYKTNRSEVRSAIDSFLNTRLDVKLYLVDNSPTDELRSVVDDPRVEYIFNNGNIGFGKAHNIAIRKAVGESHYHLVLNPDVRFDPGTLESIKKFIDADPSIGLVLPKVLFQDGSLQRLCKLLPTPKQLFFRRFLKAAASRKVDFMYEMHFADYNSTFEAPFLSGCFMFIRSSVFEKVGMFDERIFLYWEDLDLSRRIHEKYRTVYFPGAIIFHEYKRGAHRNYRLLALSIKSLLYYFFKWGWFEKKREEINRRILDQHNVKV